MEYVLVRDLTFADSSSEGGSRVLFAGLRVSDVRPEDLLTARDRIEAREMVDRHRAKGDVRIVFDDCGTWRTAVVGRDVKADVRTRRVEVG